MDINTRGGRKYTWRRKEGGGGKRKRSGEKEGGRVEEEAVRERMNYNIHSYNHQPCSPRCLVGSCIGSHNPPHSGDCDEFPSSGLYELLAMVN